MPCVLVGPCTALLPYPKRQAELLVPFFYPARSLFPLSSPTSVTHRMTIFRFAIGARRSSPWVACSTRRRCSTPGVGDLYPLRPPCCRCCEHGGATLAVLRGSAQCCRAHRCSVSGIAGGSQSPCRFWEASMLFIFACLSVFSSFLCFHFLFSFSKCINFSKLVFLYKFCELFQF